ncbi:MAG TPA: amidohydrolase family protein [Chloroflexota bacterium]|jgi:predicted TIM-barrel fold metal-dependent hydrolase|nr:amidohydrolase family protein [Chloroflexota bacterium]
MDIVDTHGHLGPSPTGSGETDEAEVIAAMEAHGVAATLVMPQSLQPDERSAHDRIARFAAANPGRIFGMASISPLRDEASYFAEARRCVRELGFKALKLHPGSYNTAPTLPRALKCFRAAAELGVPLLIHTGLGSPAALPSLVIPRAREFPDLPIVLAHAGFVAYADEALVAAQVCPNIYLEPSWCQYYQARRMVEAIGSERMLMGSDHPANLAVELAKWRATGISEADLANALGHNARRLFGLPAQ